MPSAWRSSLYVVMYQCITAAPAKTFNIKTIAVCELCRVVAGQVRPQTGARLGCLSSCPNTTSLIGPTLSCISCRQSQKQHSNVATRGKSKIFHWPQTENSLQQQCNGMMQTPLAKYLSLSFTLLLCNNYLNLNSSQWGF